MKRREFARNAVVALAGAAVASALPAPQSVLFAMEICDKTYRDFRNSNDNAKWAIYTMLDSMQQQAGVKLPKSEIRRAFANPEARKTERGTYYRFDFYKVKGTETISA